VYFKKFSWHPLPSASLLACRSGLIAILFFVIFSAGCGAKPPPKIQADTARSDDILPSSEISKPLENEHASVEATEPTAQQNIATQQNIIATKLPGFIGSAGCAECHRERYESYLSTDHSRSLRKPVLNEEISGRQFVHRMSGRGYSTSTSPTGDLLHTESLLIEGAPSPIPVQQKKIDLVMGSGAFAKSYLSCDREGCIQSPLTYYVGGKDYAMSPGYDREKHSGFKRQVNDQCLFCHVGLLSRKEDNFNHFEIHEMAIGCERCHGPGAAHTSMHKNAKDDGKPSDAAGELKDLIVSPAKMTRSQVQSLCAQCHLQGTVSFYEPGMDAWSFHPGDDLQATKAEYTVGKEGGENAFVGHFSQLDQSECFQNSEMTCVTCHDPHHVAAKGDEHEMHRQQCYSCHEDEACGIDHSIRIAENENRCVTCHMPRGKSEVPHVVITNHRIGIHLDDVEKLAEDKLAKKAKSLLPEPVALLDAAPLDSPKRRLHEAMALGRWFLSDVTPELLTVANTKLVIERLKSAMTEQTEERMDALLLLANLQFSIVSQRADEISDEEKSQLWQDVSTAAAKCEKSDVLSILDRGAATALLATTAFEFGQMKNAIARYERLIGIRRDASDNYNLGLCYGKLKRFAEAELAFNAAIARDVTYAAPYRSLARLYESISQAQSQSYAERAEMIDAARPRPSNQ